VEIPKKLAKASIKVLTYTLITVIILANPIQVLAFDHDSGEQIFLQHCSGCHVKGGNIVRRGKTLKLSALKKNGIDNPEAIAKIAREGIGIMNGYEEILKRGDDELVAKWIWKQAQKAWIQG
tara:strand:- start:389 stop:754 length:366 start_codon:yes stop_codon:yes gene_type:complete